MGELALKSVAARGNRATADGLQNLSAEGIHWRFVARPLIWRPPTDVFETDEHVIIRVEIAGMREEDFVISLEDRLVTIRGTRLDINERRAYHQLEIPFGEFSTEIELPCPVETEKATAAYQDGLLRVTLPKAQPHQVRVEQ